MNETKELPPEWLETERLYLRPFAWTDAETVLKIASDRDTTRYLCYWAHPGVTPEMDVKRFLGAAVEGWSKTPVRCREYALVRKEDGAVIGDGSIEYVDETTAEIGWILLPEYRHQGYVHEMAQRLIAYGRQEMRATHIIAHCDARNAPSYHVMQKLGMTLEQVVPEGRPLKDGIRGDEMTWGLRYEKED